MKLKKAIIALYQKIVTVLYLYSYTNLSFQEVMLLWQRITVMIWMKPEIPRTNMTTEARTAVRTAPRTRARTITRIRLITRRKTIVKITVTNSVVGPFPVMDRKWAFYIWYSKTRRTGDGRMCQTVSMRQLEWWIQRNMPMYLIDVRDRESYEKGHLQGAVSVPLEELETQMGTFPRDRMIVCCCQRGSSSLMACRKLSEAGFRAVNAAGGLMAYRGNHLVS